MDRQYYLDLAAQGLRMPIGTDLVLHERADAQQTVVDGRRLGQVVVESARRYRTPLAMPLMDLAIEKAWLLSILGVPAEQHETYQFATPPEIDMRKLDAALASTGTPRLTATVEAVRLVARETELLPVGMSIGPFSLTTKMMLDPITPVFLAGSGLTAADEPEVALFTTQLAISEKVIHASLRRQIEAGARMIVVCEPAANTTFISPNQMADGSDVFERFIIEPNRRLRKLLNEHGVDLFLHDCGELTDEMLRRLVMLDPAVLSLGASRTLWLDAAIVPKTTVLYGNLPTKRFYSDELTPVGLIEKMTRELIGRMREVRHPFILGSECDVLSVTGAHDAISRKVRAMLDCPAS
ncbi:MAG: hypothetical protein IT441_01575 [Phycisphaeraceae bacterium]|nr:hypothetical protein [Phycisphaeraceae bacterium]